MRDGDPNGFGIAVALKETIILGHVAIDLGGLLRITWRKETLVTGVEESWGPHRGGREENPPTGCQNQIGSAAGTLATFGCRSAVGIVLKMWLDFSGK